MELFLILCILVPAHAYSRNQNTTTVPTREPVTKAATHVKKPDSDPMDDLCKLVYGYDINQFTALASSFQGEIPDWHSQTREFDEFWKKWIHWDIYSDQKRMYGEVFLAFLDIARARKTRRQAKAKLIAEWLSLPDNMQDELKADYAGFIIIDDMAHGRR